MQNQKKKDCAAVDKFLQILFANNFLLASANFVIKREYKAI